MLEPNDFLQKSCPVSPYSEKPLFPHAYYDVQTSGYYVFPLYCLMQE